jgi:hypothetical protein
LYIIDGLGLESSRRSKGAFERKRRARNSCLTACKYYSFPVGYLYIYIIKYIYVHCNLAVDECIVDITLFSSIASGSSLT